MRKCKAEKRPPAEQETEYQYLCGGIQPVFISATEESENQEAAYCCDWGGLPCIFIPETNESEEEKA